MGITFEECEKESLSYTCMINKNIFSSLQKVKALHFPKLYQFAAVSKLLNLAKSLHAFNISWRQTLSLQGKNQETAKPRY